MSGRSLGKVGPRDATAPVVTRLSQCLRDRGRTGWSTCPSKRTCSPARRRCVRPPVAKRLHTSLTTHLLHAICLLTYDVCTHFLVLT